MEHLRALQVTQDNWITPCKARTGQADAGEITGAVLGQVWNIILKIFSIREPLRSLIQDRGEGCLVEFVFEGPSGSSSGKWRGQGWGQADQ